MVTMTDFAEAFGFDSKKDGVWTVLGKVTAVAPTYLMVKIGGASDSTKVERYCEADVGDIVFVTVSNGRTRAIARNGGDAPGLAGRMAAAEQAIAAKADASSVYTKTETDELVSDTADDIAADVASTYATQSTVSALSASTEPVILYDDDTNTVDFLTTPVTLSETAANFERIVICYTCNDGQYNSVEVWHPDQKHVQFLVVTYTSSAYYYMKVAVGKIEGTAIRQSGYAGCLLLRSSNYPSSTPENNFYITQVIGYRGV